jgi:uncharacterized protein YjbJ (UPF0337 family)
VVCCRDLVFLGWGFLVKPRADDAAHHPKLPTSSFDHHHAERLIRDPSEYLGGLLTPPRATGYLTGNQQKQTEGNLENEKAQWEYKQATSEGIAAVPIPSVEGVKGKVESVVGMVTGDQERQRVGNVKAEKAAWTEGV